METAFDLFVWRAALIDAAPIPTGADLAEWAILLGDKGFEDAAALLADIAALHQGFSPQAMLNRTQAAPVGGTFGAMPGSGAGWTLHRAQAELCHLARMAAGLDRPRLTQPAKPVSSGRPDNPVGIGSCIPAAEPIGDVVTTARSLRIMLEDPSPDARGMLALLRGLVEAGRRHPLLDYRRFANADIGVLVPAIALVSLMDFALATRDLWDAPLGTATLFHRTARLDSAGLGPYLSNIDRLARDSRDVFDLARIAAEATDDGEIGPWIILLSRGCKHAMQNEVIDDLGDVAAQDALSAILDRTASRMPKAIDAGTVMRLRDAALDNADYALAARAQRTIVRLYPESELEGVILGSIEANAGAFAQAEAIFRVWLERSPNNLELRRRIATVRANRIDGLEITSGFGSPADRRDTRLRRRGVPAGYPRRPGERIMAVDVG